MKIRSHFFTKLHVPTTLPQVFCTVFCITERWPGQPKNVILNAENFSCEGFTGTYDGPNAQSCPEGQTLQNHDTAYNK
jgi:hypothetical protein